MILIIGLSCLLLLKGFSYVPRSDTVPSAYVPKADGGNVPSLPSETKRATSLPSETNQEPLTDQQLCLNVLRRTQSFKQSLLKECEHLVGNLPIIKTYLERTLTYLSWHNSATTRAAPDKRTLTWKCLRPLIWCGGYGDQVRGMAYTFVLALLTDRVLYIQWPNLYIAKSENDGSTHEDSNMFVPNAINWTVPSFLSNVSAMQFIDLDAYHEPSGVCEALYSQTQHITYNTMHWHPTCFSETLMANHTASLALKELLKAPTDALEFSVTVTIRLLLKYSNAVYERKKELKKELGIGPDSHFVAIHIRSGIFASGVDESKSGSYMTSEIQWEEQIECALNKSKALGITGPVAVISDSTQCKQWARKRYGNKVIASDIATMHIAKDPNSWTDTATMKKKIKRYNSVLANTAELAFMSDAAAIGMRGSGFPRISAWLGGLPTDAMFCCPVANCGTTVALVLPGS